MTIDAVSQFYSRRVIQEADADVTTRRSAVLIINRSNINVFIGWTSGCLDRLNQLGCTGFDGAVVGFPVAVLHLYYADNIRFFQIHCDGLGQLLNLTRTYARIEVLNIVGGDQQFVLVYGNCGGFLYEAAWGNAWQTSVGRDDLIVTVVVADNACNISSKLIACANFQARITVGNQEALRVEVAGFF
ncbi:hypothetical protein D3C75_803460 [compost metagenome]